MRPDNIAVVTDVDTLNRLAEDLQYAATMGKAVRLTVDGGLKVAIGGGMWTPPLGRLADQVGR